MRVNVHACMGLSSLPAYLPDYLPIQVSLSTYIYVRGGWKSGGCAFISEDNFWTTYIERAVYDFIGIH